MRVTYNALVQSSDITNGILPTGESEGERTLRVRCAYFSFSLPIQLQGLSQGAADPPN